MIASLLFALATVATPCTGLSGWDDGREGRNPDAACAAVEDYGAAHRLGAALHELRRERDGIETGLEAADATQRALLQRRQRQIDIDLEAIRGVATTRGWPLDIPAEITP